MLVKHSVLLRVICPIAFCLHGYWTLVKWGGDPRTPGGSQLLAAFYPVGLFWGGDPRTPGLYKPSCVIALSFMIILGRLQCIA